MQKIGFGKKARLIAERELRRCGPYDTAKPFDLNGNIRQPLRRDAGGPGRLHQTCGGRRRALLNRHPDLSASACRSEVYHVLTTSPLGVPQWNENPPSRTGDTGRSGFTEKRGREDAVL